MKEEFLKELISISVTKDDAIMIKVEPEVYLPEKSNFVIGLLEQIKFNILNYSNRQDTHTSGLGEGFKSNYEA